MCARSIAETTPLFALALVGAALSFIPALAGAQSAGELSYQAPASCPNRDEFARRLRARLGSEATAPLGARIAIRLEHQRAQTIGEITVRRGESESRRRVHAASCGEAVDALTLVTALLLEAHSSEASEGSPAARERRGPERRRAAEPPREPASAEPPREEAEAAPKDEPAPSRRDDAQAPSAREDARATSDRDDRERERAPSPSQSSERTTQPPASSSTQSDARGAKRARAARARSALDIGYELAASATLSLRALPQAKPGVLGRASLLFGVDRRVALALELSGRGALPHTVRTPEGDATFRLGAAAAAVCARAALTARVRIASCAEAELGRLRADARRTDEPAPVALLWVALGPAARISTLLTGPLWLHGGGELLFPLARDRFQLGTLELWSVPPLTVRLELGLALHFP